MCGGGPQWKREVVPDHKFDFIDTRDFTDHGWWMRTLYLFLYVIVLKSFLVYVFDIFTAITMLTTDTWSNSIFKSCTQSDKNGCVFIPFTVGKWLFVGCIIFSFLLLAYEARKARKIVQSRDISYAYTNIMANNYYSLRSYDHFCFFSRINNSTKRTDDFAFFIFFTFKTWKRVLLADGPRQVINGLTLYSFYLSQKDKPGSAFDISKYTNGSLITGALIFSTASTVLLFIGSALLLAVAGICYVPLLCYIRGNLKEYCCYKVDKRISEIVKRKKKERLAQAAKIAKKEAAGDFSHLKNKKGEIVNALPQPTLPDIKLDDDDMDDGRTITTNNYYGDYKSNYSTDYPPMPAFKQQYSAYPPSLHSTDDPSYYYADQYDSKTNLAAAAAPIAGQNGLTNPHSATYDGSYNYGSNQNGGYGAHDAYAGYGHEGAGTVPGEYGNGNHYGYGQSKGYEQDVSQGYAYEPQMEYTGQHQSQPQSHLTTMQLPQRTASRAANPHMTHETSYAQSTNGYGGGYDAYGRV